MVERRIRVERALLKDMPEVVSSVEDEYISQDATEDEILKKKVLKDFKPKSSDTHRSDKKRRAAKPTQETRKIFKKGEYMKVKNGLN